MRGPEGWGPEGCSPEGCGPEGWGPEGWGPEGWGPEGWGPELWGPEGWGPEGWGPEGWGPGGWGAQNFALFFPSPAAKFVLFFPLWGSSRGILVVFEAPGRSNVRVWSSLVVVCEPRRPGLVGPPGFHTTTRELQTCTFEGPGLQKHHQNSTRRPPEREEKNEFCGGRGKKKSEILGGPGEGRSGEGRSRGRAVQGKGGPGEGRSRGRAAQGKGGPGEGRSAVQTKP